MFRNRFNFEHAKGLKFFSYRPIRATGFLGNMGRPGLNPKRETTGSATAEKIHPTYLELKAEKRVATRVAFRASKSDDLPTLTSHWLNSSENIVKFYGQRHEPTSM